MPRLLPTIFWFLLGSVISAQDFTGSWSLLGNGYKGEIYLKQEGSRVRGWIGVGGVNLDGDVITGTVQGNEINFTRANPLLARPQEWRGFLSVHNNPAIEARRRATGADTMAGIGNHMGSWNFSWSATRVGPYREDPARSTPSSASAPTGTWNWVSGQTLVINADNTCEVYEGSRKINECHWESLGRGQYRLTHRDGGYVDTVTLSADGNSLDGTNNQGSALHGSRRNAVTPAPPVAASPAGSWNWVSGQTLIINANNTCEVYEGSRKINECHWASLGRSQYRLTHRDGGWVDTITLSADGNSLDGTNNQGSALHGSRR